MKTVYVLGAGASKHAGYPLIADMANQWFDWMEKCPGGRYLGTVESLREAFGDSPNIEDVITAIESSIHSLEGSEVLEDRLQRAFLGNTHGELLQTLRDWFRELHLRPADAYEKFADSMIDSGDVVISFNYDDSLERELKTAGKWDISRGYGFPLGKIEQVSPVLVLKLHGSMNWIASLFGGITTGFAAVGSSSMGEHPVIHGADLEYLGYPRDFPAHTYPGGGVQLTMILPGKNKEFFFRSSLGIEWKEFFDHLWSQATGALQQADRVVVCGYGLLPVDERACKLILGVPPKNALVEIVSGNQGERIASDFRKAGYSNVSFDSVGYFENWVAQRSVAAAS